MNNIIENKHKILHIGLDLSFNSTGITFSLFDENMNPEKIKFYRIVFDNENNITGKRLKPNDIQNINQIVYRMPSNIKLSDINLVIDDKNTSEQLTSTLQAMICSKKINQIIADNIMNYGPNKIICTMENYIMPNFGGPNSLRNVSGLLLLQGFVREFFVKLSIQFPQLIIKLFTPTPKQTKKYFTGNGNAEKKEMLESFINNFQGQKLLPVLNRGKLDDIIDSFALMCHGLYMSKISKNKTIVQL